MCVTGNIEGVAEAISESWNHPAFSQFLPQKPKDMKSLDARLQNFWGWIGNKQVQATIREYLILKFEMEASK